MQTCMGRSRTKIGLISLIIDSTWKVVDVKYVHRTNANFSRSRIPSLLRNECETRPIEIQPSNYPKAHPIHRQQQQNNQSWYKQSFTILTRIIVYIATGCRLESESRRKIRWTRRYRKRLWERKPPRAPI